MSSERGGPENTAMPYLCLLSAGMDLFASCLWHLRCDVELSVITETLMTSDPRRVEGLCAKATSLNLSQDHEGAVKCLQKAITVSISSHLQLHIIYCIMFSIAQQYLTGNLIITFQ